VSSKRKLWLWFDFPQMQDNIQAIRALAGSSEYKDHTEFEGSQLLSFVPGRPLYGVCQQ